MTNLFADIPRPLCQELIKTLLQAGSVRIERIVSHGHSSPADFWYDQEEGEWVLLVRGKARLQFEHETRELKPGDFVNIPPHRKHRVAGTTSDEPTIWLAVFYSDSTFVAS